MSKPKTSELTKREKEIANWLALGYTCREIAADLGLSTKTVDTHKTNLMRKLQVHNRVDLVRSVLKIGLLTYSEWLHHR